MASTFISIISAILLLKTGNFNILGSFIKHLNNQRLKSWWMNAGKSKKKKETVIFCSTYKTDKIIKKEFC